MATLTPKNRNLIAWYCTKCKRYNKTNTICKKCSTVTHINKQIIQLNKKKNIWICNYCVRYNYKNKCKQCLRTKNVATKIIANIPMPPKIIPRKVNKKQWTCNYCTYENKTNRTKCEMCNNIKKRKIQEIKEKKIEEVKKEKIDEDEHICKICFENKNDCAFTHKNEMSGHALCYKCAIEINKKNRHCPFCRKEIYNIIKIYL